MAAVAQKSVFFYTHTKSLLIGNTWESLQCVRMHQKAPEGACCLFKVLTLARAILKNNCTLRRCLWSDLVLEVDPKSLHSEVNHQIRSVIVLVCSVKFFHNLCHVRGLG